MAGPWFVDPENGLVTNNGLTEETPWKYIPGQTGWTTQTGYASLVAGDIVNVKNGTATSLQLVPPQINLTYRGYGTAPNVLVLTLPNRDPRRTYRARVVREAGVHEGMWRIEGCTSSTCIDTGVRTGVTFEDVSIVGNSNQTSRLIAFAASSQDSTGLTLRRFELRNAPQAGIQVYSKNCLIEWGRIENCTGDGISLAASAVNGYKAGTRDTLRYLEIIEPGVGGAVGDAVQTLPLTNRYEGGLKMQAIYLRKTNAVKQAMILSDATGGITLDRFHFEGTPTSHCQIGIETLKGALSITNGYVYEGGKDNALIRFVTSSGTAAGTGSSLRVSNVLHDAQESAGFFTAASVTLAATADGSIELANCVSKAANTQGLSYSGSISFHPGALLTWGINATASVKNCALSAGSQPAVRLPTGTANNANWAVTKNHLTGTAGTIGATSYATVTALQAAHSAATGNLDSEPMLSSGYRLLPGSPLIGAGVRVAWVSRDLAGVKRPNPPSIGIHDPATLRRTA